MHKCSADQEPNSMIMCSLNVKMEVTLLTYNMHKIGLYIIQAQSQENRNLAECLWLAIVGFKSELVR